MGRGSGTKLVVKDQDFTKKLELYILHGVAIVLHIVSGSLGAALAANTVDLNVNVIAPYFEYVTGTKGVYLKPTPTVIFTVAILWPPIAVEFITAAFHALYILPLASKPVDAFFRRYIADTSSLNPLRWIEYAITATLMSAFGTIAMGETDVFFFLKMIASGIGLQSVGYVLEVLSSRDERALLFHLYQENRASLVFPSPAETDLGRVLKEVALGLKKREARLYTILWWVIGFFLNITNVVVLLWQTFGSNLGSALGIYVANTLPFALWFQTFGIIAQLTFRRYKQFEDRFFSEKWYIILSLSTKIAVFWLALGTFRQIIEDNGAVARSGIRWDAVRYCAMILPAVWVIVYAVYDATTYTRRVKERLHTGSDDEEESYKAFAARGGRGHVSRKKPRPVW